MTEVPKPREAGKRRDEEVKYLSIMSWTPDKAKEVTELFLKWEIPKDLKILYGPCNVLGGNKSVTICEATDIALAKVDRYFRHVATLEINPLMDSAEIAKIK